MCQKPPLAIRRCDRHTILRWFPSSFGWLVVYIGTNNLTMLKNQALHHIPVYATVAVQLKRKKKKENERVLKDLSHFMPFQVYIYKQS